MDEAHGSKLSGWRSVRSALRSRLSAHDWRRALRWSLTAVGVLVALLVAFPTGRYLLRAGWEEGWILLRRRAIAKIVNDSTAPAAVRAKLMVVQAARAYAADSLHLSAGKSFTAYSAVKSDTLVLVLSAAYRDRLEFYRWWFPIVGSVPYKGWFDFAAAQREEEKFRDDGFDTMLRPSSAFSTLGWFNDPLLSTTLRADSLWLANTVIHELTHNEFYAPGQAEFNESFANFVGARGSAEFFRRRGSIAASDEAEARWEDEKALGAFWRRLYQDVDSVFKAHPGDSARQERLVLRDSVYRVAKRSLVYQLAPALHTVSPRYLEQLRIDNATVLASRIYQTDLALFDSVFFREGDNVRKTVKRVIALAKADPKQPYASIRAWLKKTGP